MPYYQGLPTHGCGAKWLPVFVARLKREGATVRFTQLVGSYGPSAGTHAGCAFDLVVTSGSYSTVVRIARQMGADATWERPYNWDGRRGIRHVHGLLTGCPHHSQAALNQITQVRRGQNGLANYGPDTGPRPLSGRTWQQGIAWAGGGDEDELTPAEKKQLADAHRWARESVIILRDLRIGRKGEYHDGPGGQMLREVHRTLSPGGKTRTLVETTKKKVDEVHQTLMPGGVVRTIIAQGRTGVKGKWEDGIQGRWLRDLHRTLSPGGQVRTMIEKAAKAGGK